MINCEPLNNLHKFRIYNRIRLLPQYFTAFKNPPAKVKYMESNFTPFHTIKYEYLCFLKNNKPKKKQINQRFHLNLII